MRILQVAPYFPPYLGGQERYIYNLGRGLVSLGHEVWVLTSNFPESIAVETVDGIKVIRYKCIARILRNPITPGLVLPKEDLQGFDVIHAHNEHSFAAIAGLFLRRRLGIPLVLTHHGKLIFGSFLPDMATKLYDRTIGRIILRHADKVIVNSPSDANRILRAGVDEKNLAVIPNAIDRQHWTPYLGQDCQEFARRYNLLGKKVILFTGQIIKRKGIDHLLRALLTIVKSRPDTTCLFAGDGSHKTQAEALAKQLKIEAHVQFAGTLSDSDLAMAYKRADVCVLPSLSESVPTSLMEAMIFSKPVVATDIEGIRDFFGEVALLVPPQNADELSSAILKVLDDQTLATRLGEEGRRLVSSRFTWKRSVTKILRVYEEVAR